MSALDFIVNEAFSLIYKIYLGDENIIIESDLSAYISALNISYAKNIVFIKTAW